MQRAFDALRYLGIATALYLAASASATWAGVEIVAETEPAALDPAPPQRATKRKSNQASRRYPTRPSFEHNPFCPECTPEPEEDEGESGLPSDPEAPFGVASQTQLPLELLATMEAEPAGASLATLAGPTGTGAFGIGEVVLPGVRLAGVNEGAILLANGDSLEYLEMGVKPVPKKKSDKPTPSKKKSTRSRKRSWEIEGAADAVKCHDLDCTVERAFIDELIRNPSQLMTQARVRPYSHEGLRGFRLSRVRRGTLPQLLGLRSGDVVTRINGRELKTMDAALAMASRLRSSSHLSVAVTRNRGGERFPLQLEITIVS